MQTTNNTRTTTESFIIPEKHVPATATTLLMGELENTNSLEVHKLEFFGSPMEILESLNYIIAVEVILLIFVIAADGFLKLNLVGGRPMFYFIFRFEKFDEVPLGWLTTVRYKWQPFFSYTVKPSYSYYADWVHWIKSGVFSYMDFRDNLLSAFLTGRIISKIIDFFIRFSLSFFKLKTESFTRQLIPAFGFTFFCVIIFGLSALAPQSNLLLTSALPVVSITISWILYSFITSCSKFGINAFVLFVPAGAPIYLLKFLVLVELVSYLARLISLPARLIANAVAGHLLVKVLSCFCCVILLVEGLAFSALFLFPTILCFLLTYLDFVIIFIQTFVFMFLLVFYVNHALSVGSHSLEHKRITFDKIIHFWLNKGVLFSYDSVILLFIDDVDITDFYKNYEYLNSESFIYTESCFFSVDSFNFVQAPWVLFLNYLVQLFMFLRLHDDVFNFTYIQNWIMDILTDNRSLRKAYYQYLIRSYILFFKRPKTSFSILFKRVLTCNYLAWELEFTLDNCIDLELDTPFRPRIIQLDFPFVPSEKHQDILEIKLVFLRLDYVYFWHRWI